MSGRRGFSFSNAKFQQVGARYILAVIACVAGVTLLSDFANAQATSTSITPPRNLGQIAQNVSRPMLSVVQSQIQSIRDAIFGRKIPLTGGPGGRAFAAVEQDAEVRIAARLEDNPLYSISGDYGLLSYTKRERSGAAPVFKSQPVASTQAPVIGAWIQGFGDIERRTGFSNGVDIGSKSRSGGGVGGVDVTLRNALSSDVLVLGIVGSGVHSRVHNNDGSTATVEGPSIGLYALWLKDSFSIDVMFKTDFLDLSASSLASSVRFNNYVTSWNINYRQEYGQWWIEPTVGVNWTHSVWDNTFSNGDTWRVQGGIRVGTAPFNWNGIAVSPVVTALIYEDVSVSGGALATATTSTPTDEGKIAGKLAGKLSFEHGGGLTSFIEVEGRALSHVLGGSANVGLRRAF